MLDLQKASIWKRISAATLDLILLFIAAVGFAYLLSACLGYDSHAEALEQHYQRYEKEYDIDLEITPEAYETLPEEKQEQYRLADEAFAKDEAVSKTYSMLFNLTLIITTFSILIGFLLLELMVPLLLRNGQTLGKKIFGIAVMQEEGIRITPALLFARTILGKYTVETMVPVLLFMMIWFGVMGLEATILIFALLLVQICLLAFSKTRSVIHDKMSHTVAVDMSSQMIFDTHEALLAYKQKLHAQAVENRSDL